MGEYVTPHRSARGERDAEIGLVRTTAGWRVNGGGETFPDLINAMVLADLLAAEEQATASLDGPPPRAGSGASETELLRVTVAQLEHALHTRVVVEQAIGVLSERHGTAPRQAFERLRHAARSRGRKVTELARDVVDSAHAPAGALPAELVREGAPAAVEPPRPTG
ncbi:ANTAR domain-containing protein [Nocardiopsis ansamitocini]|uniref:ANTAR domain-containing protein n=1 Tax=Nocardiopsis ansamitocini TaxID=1670832 RepID=A0A9W6UHL7_9ACTN|nr:ANTAR domain-containing protein [Nocardiopsis ansamitocini]GLU46759.1 hypothetical protein Nans01_11100 [Nocardiopsis ansamitocini]